MKTTSHSDSTLTSPAEAPDKGVGCGELASPPNPPAFPYAFQHGDDSYYIAQGFSPGMTLRDHFAGLALLGYMQSCSLHDQPQLLAPNMAHLAYYAADAMLAERAKANDKISNAESKT